MPFSPLTAVADGETRWAARNMPLVTESVRARAAAFDGQRIAMCLHVEPKTAVLVGLLAEAGAEVFLTGSPGTTKDATADALRAIGVTVVGQRSDDEAAHRRNIEQVLGCDPHLVLDNGADLITGVLAAGATANLIGATEETTTGGLRIRSGDTQPPFPVVVINDSRLKLLVENEFGVGQGVVQGFMNATNLMLPGARATVVGHGPCGRGVANTLARLGARVSVVEPDPYRALEAVMHGHRVGTLAEVLPDTRLLFLATGAPSVLGGDALDLLADETVIAGVGHFAWELDVDALAERTASVTRIGETATHRLHDGRNLVVLSGTRMINLTAARGNPIEAMDLGLTLQARSLAAVATTALPPGPQPVPAEVDRAIAADLVKVLTR